MSAAIILENIGKQLGNRTVLSDVSFVVEKGDIFGYLGPNGAGKTTTIRIILGLMTPGSGKVAILGGDPDNEETRKRVGFVLEADGLYDSMTAAGNLEYYARLYDLSEPGERVRRALEMVNLLDRAHDRVSTYSKGMRQRLALARAVVHDPQVLVLDEPTAGIDPSGQIELRKLVLDMAQKEGKTIFLSSHNLDEVQRICNRIALIDRGIIRLYGELAQLQNAMGRREVQVEARQPVPAAAIARLNSLKGVTARAANDRNIVLDLTASTIEVADIVDLLAGQGVRIEQVKRREPSLEDMYTSILKEVEQGK